MRPGKPNKMESRIGLAGEHLTQLNARHVGDLKRCLPQERIDALFSGSTGHDLHRLGETSALRRCLAAQGKEALLDQKEWKLMGGQRPYSLRYGFEKVTGADAKDQVAFAKSLADVILMGAT